MNFGCGDVEEGAVCTTKYTLHSKHPLKQSVSFSSSGFKTLSASMSVAYPPQGRIHRNYGKNYGKNYGEIHVKSGENHIDLI